MSLEHPNVNSDPESDDADSENEESAEEEEEDEEDEEAEREYELAKYWHVETQQVVTGVARCMIPVALDSLCGTYHWVYEIPEPHYDWPSEIDYPHQTGAKDWPGHLTLSFPKDKDASLENLSGNIDHFGKKGKWDGVEQVKNWKGIEMANYWDIKLLRWEEIYGDNEEEGNALQILEVCDDDGNPFVMFKYGGQGRRGEMEYLDMVGKKYKATGAAPQPLTQTERSRLGMEMSAPEVNKRARAALADATAKPKTLQENNHDEGDPKTAKGSTSIDTSSSTGENKSSGEVTGSSTQSTTSGVKRKANDSGDNEAEGSRKIKAGRASA